MITLSILIPTTYARNEIIKPLLKTLNSQRKNKPVELIINDHETDCIGKKRNSLLSDAKGLYIVFVDSDDMVSDDYVDKILKAAENNTDCIGISGIITTNGHNKRKWHISKDYGSWYFKDNVYYRTPNHISPVKRHIALKHGFPEISMGEDFDYSMRILPDLKSEVKIKGCLYKYLYNSKK